MAEMVANIDPNTAFNSEITKVEELTRNIFANCYDRLEDYLETVGWFIEPKRTQPKPLEIGEKLSLEYTLKPLLE